MTIPPPPSSSRRLLPTLAAGPGERRDCANYAGPTGCLSRWCRSSRGDSDVHCPPDCHAFAEVPRWLHAELAMTGRAEDRATPEAYDDEPTRGLFANAPEPPRVREKPAPVDDRPARRCLECRAELPGRKRRYCGACLEARKRAQAQAAHWRTVQRRKGAA